MTDALTETAPTPEGSPQFEVRGVSLSFGGLVALNDVTFDVRAGESLGVIGPNGAGKSSLLNCINGVYKPQAGSLRLDGVDLVGRRPADIARLGISRTFQG